MPPWVWFIGGVLITSFAFTLYIISQPQPQPVPLAEPDKQKPQPRPEQPRPQQGQSKPQFEFYSVLPEMEVEVPPDQLRPSAATATKASGIYQLQLGSYRRIDDAKRMEASLGLIGIAAHIESVTINEKTHYRVRSGPYTREQAYGLHTRLKGHDVESQILKMKKK